MLNHMLNYPHMRLVPIIIFGFHSQPTEVSFSLAGGPIGHDKQSDLVIVINIVSAAASAPLRPADPAVAVAGTSIMPHWLSEWPGLTVPYTGVVAILVTRSSLATARPLPSNPPLGNAIGPACW
jgi:hypothetical protein